MPRGQKVLSKQELTVVLKKLAARAKSLNVRYAVIGGALFTLLGIDGYETRDIDVAATKYLDLPNAPLEKLGFQLASFCPKGHYILDGVSIDWMPFGKSGSEGLWKVAIETATPNEDGIMLADINVAMAIKLWAGRDNDKEVYDWFLDMNYINSDIVHALIDKHCKKEKQ